MLNFAGDYELVALEIISKGVSIDVRFLMMELNIYEDLFGDGLTADIMIADAVNLPLRMPIVGEELLNIVMNTPLDEFGETESIRLEMPIIAMTDRKFVKDRQQVIVLRAVSQPMFESSKTLVSKAYKGKKHSEIVSDIFTEYMDPSDIEDIEVEPSRYVEDLIITSQKPLEAINWIKNRAVSGSGFADYFFYQSRAGYNFKTLNTLVKQEPITTLTTSLAGTGQPLNLNIVLGFYVDSAFNTKQNMERGMLSSTLVGYDMENKRIDTNTFNYRDQYELRDHLGVQKFVYENNELEDVNNRLYVRNISDSSRTKEWLMQRTSVLQSLNTYRVVVSIPGNTAINVGDIIELDLLSTEFLDQSIDPQIDNHLSGKWLITSLRHKMTMETHIMILDLAKESFNDKLIIDDPSVGQAREVEQNSSRFFA